MRIYIDSADIVVIEQALATGFVYGITCNPVMVQRAGLKARDIPKFAKRALELGAREVQAQVYSLDKASMIEQANEIREVDPARLVVKIPATAAGYTATRELKGLGARITMTAVYTLAQALAAVEVGADHIGVYLGRLRDDGIDALDRIDRMQRMYKAQNAKVEIIAASVQAAAEVEAVAELGVAGVAAPLTVIEEMMSSPGTDAAMTQLEQAARQILSI